MEIPFFIVGASARDYILDYVYNRPAVRMTMDVDIGVKVENWEQYEKIVSALLQTGKFIQENRNHRFLHGDVKVDIVPFGSLADQKKNIHWPPDQTTIMSVLGFQEAYEHSVTIKLKTDPLLAVHEIRLSSCPRGRSVCYQRAKQKEAINPCLLFYVVTTDRHR